MLLRVRRRLRNQARLRPVLSSTSTRPRGRADLRIRHRILWRCMSTHTQNLTKMAPDESSGDEDDRRPENMQAFWQNLWASWQRPQPSRSARSPMDAYTPPSDAPQGIRRPTYLPEGSDTVRSSMSYLTARSTTSCAEEVTHGESPRREMRQS